ncbi:MAG TPA: TraX family protein [Oscillospiraceae bacterium]|nr:TraX family protein [Oscillospiraceae bacterium]HPS33946.1 TraX family protein [Oscillospiraceae bacterium]
MSTTVLKFIAILTMLIDHLGASGLIPYGSPWYTVCRVIGRLAFPLFCFCVAEGLKYSKNRKNYILRMFIFALVSEVPFDLMIHQTWFTWQGQNVIFTLLLAVIGITVFEQPELLGRIMQKYEKNPETYAYQNADWVVKSFILAVCALLAYILKTDYAWFGVCLIYVMYFTGRWSKPKRYIAVAATIIGYGLLSSLVPASDLNISVFGGYGAVPFTSWFFYKITIYYWLAASASLILIMLYNNRKGKGLKWLFYVFYPAHMLILYLFVRFDLVSKIGTLIGIS